MRWGGRLGASPCADLTGLHSNPVRVKRDSNTLAGDTRVVAWSPMEPGTLKHASHRRNQTRTQGVAPARRGWGAASLAQYVRQASKQARERERESEDSAIVGLGTRPGCGIKLRVGG